MKEKIKHTLLTIVLCFVIICFHGTTFALETATHFYLNDLIARGNYGGWSLDSYLKDNLKFANGVTEPIPQYDTVVNRIANGGITEDIPYWWAPYIRSMKHFHDPTVSNWNSAGIKGMQSSILWAEQPNQSSSLGNYSWPDARNYFYNALTATNANDRNTNYAECFRAMGQLMHLIQDASVAEHTRNDFHYFYNYEDKVLQLQGRRIKLQDMLPSSTICVDYSLLNRTGYNSGATIPIAGLFDSGQYIQSQPNIPNSSPLGLAEYSNANFFSNDTIVSKYPNPKLSDCVKSVVMVDDPRHPGSKIARKYYTKTFENTTGFKLAAFSYQWFWGGTYLPEQNAYLTVRDDNVYTDYATKLIPKAVTYSAGLLNYFFRGQIDAVDATATKDADGNISGVIMKIKNNTPKIGSTNAFENISSGKFAVSYQYNNGSVFGCSTTVAFAGYSSTYNFRFKSSIPSDATDKKYLLVFRGKLGAENDVVAGKKFDPGTGDIYLAWTTEIDIYNSVLHVARLNKDTGIKKWEQEYPFSLLSGDPIFLQSAVTKDGFYVIAGGDVDYTGPPHWYPIQLLTLYKLNKETGTLIWSTTADERVLGGHVWMATDNSRIYLARCSVDSSQWNNEPVPPSDITCLNSSTGASLWQIPLNFYISNYDTNWVNIAADGIGGLYTNPHVEGAPQQLTIKYDGITGLQLWQKSYGGDSVSADSKHVVMGTYASGLNANDPVISLPDDAAILFLDQATFLSYWHESNTDTATIYNFDGTALKTVTISDAWDIYDCYTGVITLSDPNYAINTALQFFNYDGRLVWEYDMPYDDWWEFQIKQDSGL